MSLSGQGTQTSTSLGLAPVYATKLVEMAEVGSPIFAGPATRVVAFCGRSSFCGGDGSTCSRNCGALHFPLCRAPRCDGLWRQFSLVHVFAMHTALLPVLSPRVSFRFIAFFLRPLVEVTPSSPPRQPVHSRDIERASVSRFQVVVSHCFKTHAGIRESAEHGLCKWTTADEQLSACTCSKRELRIDWNRRQGRMSKVERGFRSPPPPTPLFELPPFQLEAVSPTRRLHAGPPSPRAGPDPHGDWNNEAKKSLPFHSEFQSVSW